MDQKNIPLLDRFIATQNVHNARIRVWSLVVTIFGDVIEPRGGVVRLGVLQQITERLGLENNALRTAMSRLASDGWLERERIGRASFYRPSPMASEENAKACEVIYQFSRPGWNGRWIFALSTRSEGFAQNCRDEIHKQNFAFYGRKLAISPDTDTSGKAPQIEDAVMLSAEELSVHGGDAFKGNMDFHVDCQSFYQNFITDVSQLVNNTNAIGSLNGLDAMALRTLLIHNWRRIVLKDVQWPSVARPQNWCGFEAQRLMREIYHKLLPASEAWLEARDGVPGGKMPAASVELFERFMK